MFTKLEKELIIEQTSQAVDPEEDPLNFRFVKSVTSPNIDTNIIYLASNPSWSVMPDVGRWIGFEDIPHKRNEIEEDIQDVTEE